jgi:hypothetical protein
MFLIIVALTLIVVGGLLWLVNACLPMEEKTKSVLNAVVCLCAMIAPLAGCIGYTSQGRGGSGYGARSGVEATVVMQDDYVYYPGYDIYFSSNRHQYYYQDGGAWVLRAAPRGVSVDVLLASPSVRMDFHDSPERHHAEVVKKYPRNWTPPGSHQGQKENRKDDKGDKRDDHR